MKINRFNLILSAVAVLMGFTIFVLQSDMKRVKKERDRYQMNSDALLSEIKQWQADSATTATDVATLRLTIDELEHYRGEDAAKIKQMGIKIKNLETVAKHELEVNAKINAQIRDSVIIRDTVRVEIKSVSMITPYIQLSGIIEGDSLTGSVSLPVTLRQAVWVEYKRRWIFWKRVKAVHQTITSDNPHVMIKYSEYITIQR